MDQAVSATRTEQQHKTRGFERHAALDLARLYDWKGRSTDAHALLASVLEGFCPPRNFARLNKRKRCSSRGRYEPVDETCNLGVATTLDGTIINMRRFRDEVMAKVP